MKVIVREGARADLENIRHWIAKDNPARAITFVRELRQRAARLADLWSCFPVVARTDSGAIHKLGYGNYHIFYRVKSHIVEVLAVRHHARDAAPFD